MKTLKTLAGGLAVVALVLAAGILAISRNDSRSIAAETPSPSLNATAKPMPITPPPTHPASYDGLMTLTIVGPVPATAEFAVMCTRTSLEPLLVSSTLYSEQVTAAFDNGAFRLLREGNAPYSVINYDGQPGSVRDLLSDSLEFALDADYRSPDGSSIPPFEPFAGMLAGDTIVARLTADCDWASAAATPQPPAAQPEGTTRGSANLVLDAPASISVETVIDCSWSSKERASIDFPQPVEIFGESATPFLEPTDSALPPFSIRRQFYASYSGRGATFRVDRTDPSNGQLHFQNLTPDAETYPEDRPLPSPLEPFLTPLGGNPAAAALSGTMTWNCGDPPAGMPATEPTHGATPIASPGSGSNGPLAILTVAGVPGSLSGSSCGGHFVGPDGIPTWGDCFTSSWFVPTGVLEVPAGSTLVFSAGGGYKLSSADMTLASVREVTRYRGGEPGSALTVHPSSSTQGRLRFGAPGVGDWVLLLPLEGKAADGSTFEALFTFHIRVVE
jgi:hypothetical protein